MAMSTIRPFVLASLLAISTFGCAVSDEDVETIELTNAYGKQDGGASAIITLAPGDSAYLSWTCNEFLELNGCDTTLGITLSAAEVPDGTDAGTIKLKALGSTRIDTQRVLIGKTKILFHSEGISSNSAEITNQTESKLITTVTASWE